MVIEMREGVGPSEINRDCSLDLNSVVTSKSLFIHSALAPLSVLTSLKLNSTVDFT